MKKSYKFKSKYNWDIEKSFPTAKRLGWQESEYWLANKKLEDMSKVELATLAKLLASTKYDDEVLDQMDEINLISYLFLDTSKEKLLKELKINNFLGQ